MIPNIVESFLTLMEPDLLSSFVTCPRSRKEERRCLLARPKKVDPFSEERESRNCEPRSNGEREGGNMGKYDTVGCG